MVYGVVGKKRLGVGIKVERGNDEKWNQVLEKYKYMNKFVDLCHKMARVFVITYIELYSFLERICSLKIILFD